MVLVSAEWQYLIVWEFEVRPGSEARFEQVYGTNGRWAQFFARGQGYLGTELVRRADVPTRYVTLDFWISRAAYLDFREQNRQEYEAIDRECEAMTSSEVEIGTFERVPNP